MFVPTFSILFQARFHNLFLPHPPFMAVSSPFFFFCVVILIFLVDRGHCSLLSLHPQSSPFIPSLTTISNPSASPGDALASSVSLLNGYVLTGDSNATRGPCVSCGRATVFHLFDTGNGSQWVVDSELFLWNATYNANFGYWLDLFQPQPPLSTLVAIVGAPLQSVVDTQDGVLVVFQQNSGNFSHWDNITLLQSPHPQDFANFGIACAGDGDTILASSFNQTLAGLNSGEAFLFGQNVGGQNQWGLKKILIPSDSAPYSFFGYALEIDGDHALISAFSAGLA